MSDTALPGEGGLRLHLCWDGAQVVGATLASERLIGAGQVLQGRPLAEVLEAVPRLFSLCGQAQGLTALQALTAAQGRGADTEALRQRRGAAHGELLQEYLWRLFIDLPARLGEAPQPQALLPLRRVGAGAALAKAAREWLGEALFGMTPAAWLAQTDPLVWLAAAPTAPARWLAQLTAEGYAGWGVHGLGLLPPQAVALGEALGREPGFAARPHWQGVPRETGALAQAASHPMVQGAIAAHGAGVLARLLARLVRVAQLPALLEGGAPPQDGAATLAEGVGLGWVETARGLLLHRAELAGGVVRRYQILAPTEWNFHPGGPLLQGLLGQRAGTAARLERGAALALLALDPCVQCSLEIECA